MTGDYLDNYLEASYKRSISVKVSREINVLVLPFLPPSSLLLSAIARGHAAPTLPPGGGHGKLTSVSLLYEIVAGRSPFTLDSKCFPLLASLFVGDIPEAVEGRRSSWSVSSE